MGAPLCDTLFNPNRVALLGFGEAGSTLARGLKGTWCNHNNNSRRVLAVDIALGKGPRGKSMEALARELDVDISGHYTAVLGKAAVVISVVTGDQAIHAAQAAKPWLSPGSYYLDFNSITGPQTCDVAAVFDQSEIHFIDVAVMGGFEALGIEVPLLLAGLEATIINDWMNRTGFTARVLATRVGDASAVKILRSVMVKGIEALSVECLVAAHRQNLVREVLDNLGDIDRQGFAGFIETLTTTHLVHAKRRMEEVEKAAMNLRDTGIEPLMTEATRRSHLRTCEARVAPSDGTKPTLDEALNILSSKVIKSMDYR